MNQDCVKLMERLSEHVKAQMDTRATEGYKKSIQPAKSILAERKAILDEIVNVLGIPLKELQVKLGVNRTTWERWEKMQSIPKKSHLDYLRRLMEDLDKKSTRGASQQFLLQPYEFIGANPRTYAQLRVLFFHRAYCWEDAVFHFQTPFQDSGYIVDLASLALNGCKIVYMMKASQVKSSNGWAHSFVQNMKDALGVVVANQVLACLCILVIEDDEKSLPTNFGVLNYETGKKEQKVGYIWLGKEGSDSAAFVTLHNQYQPIPATDECFYILKLRYNKQLVLAFDTIAENRSKPPLSLDDSYDEEHNKFKFVIPMIDETQTPTELPIYV